MPSDHDGRGITVPCHYCHHSEAGGGKRPVGSPQWAQIPETDVVGRVGALVSAARSGGHQVVWVLHASPRSGGPFDPESGDVQVMEEFSRIPGEPVLTRTSRNAFSTARPGRHLTASEWTRW